MARGSGSLYIIGNSWRGPRCGRRVDRNGDGRHLAQLAGRWAIRTRRMEEGKCVARQKTPAPNSPRGGCFLGKLSRASLVVSRCGGVVKCGPPDDGVGVEGVGGRMCGGGT